LDRSTKENRIENNRIDSNVHGVFFKETWYGSSAGENYVAGNAFAGNTENITIDRRDDYYGCCGCSPEPEAICCMLLGLTVSLIVFFSPLVYRFRKRTISQAVKMKEILESRDDLREKSLCFPIRYCSDRRFLTRFDVFAWEAPGFLVITASRVVLFYKPRWQKENYVELNLDTKDIHVKWIGSIKIHVPAISWIRIRASGKSHFISSGAEWTYHTSRCKTWRMHEELVGALAKAKLSSIASEAKGKNPYIPVPTCTLCGGIFEPHHRTYYCPTCSRYDFSGPSAACRGSYPRHVLPLKNRIAIGCMCALAVSFLVFMILQLLYIL